jgi:hypothetical protein
MSRKKLPSGRYSQADFILDNTMIGSGEQDEEYEYNEKLIQEWASFKELLKSLTSPATKQQVELVVKALQTFKNTGLFTTRLLLTSQSLTKRLLNCMWLGMVPDKVP